ncbi:PREDICTED: probable prolyl 4-hydroxylase 3 isoform X2 [Erythranthe guttata]|uniref:probable prolyl 4-hydroxylase 3 isoform X2 n=1 Tax=Erythranthe guttata TaxID=4155 RepID=UPI00064DFFDF|nr:PREDICTED: probable prolyl 4-hydroxylase 3 isoform X2 [Erythranthe guttata]|eukprot:XP_012829596.1 PREDICTED: probable prolyl 4-hydroxylase 3 isoform X2 [Erythranthe guttata]
MAKWSGRRHQGKRFSTVVSALFMLLMLTVMLLILLGIGIFSIPIGSDEDSSPIGDPVKMKRVTLPTKSGEQWTEVLSWEPRAFLYHNFLSKEECEHLINLAKPHMVKSSVVDTETGKSIDSRIRTSSGMFFKRGHDSVIGAIEKRIADYSQIPLGTEIFTFDSNFYNYMFCHKVLLYYYYMFKILFIEHGEGIQVLHYEVGQKYEPHYDYFLDEFHTKNGDQRVATLLMYLSDVEEGGETVFPVAKGNFSSLPGWNEMSECAKKGLSVKPKMGDALLFWSLKPDATLDPSSLHGACPVIRGNKWSATKWMHLHEY